MRRNWVLWLASGAFLLIVLLAIFGPNMRHGYLDPVGKPFTDPGAQFWLGTDEQGRDVFARLAFGARMSLLVGLTVQVISLVVGVVVGVLGVFAPKWVSVPLMRLTDGMFAFPDILLAILIIGVFGMGLFPVIAALAVTAWPSVARLVKTQVASLKDREFFVASQALGAPKLYLVVKHVLPHLWGILLAVSMVDVAGTILAESSLSFLGIGIQPPDPSWGNMINQARSNMNSHPLVLLWPCLTLSLAVFALNFVGDELRSIVDPRNR
ncbi:MAG: ABC transporter permease [Armatimonadetes bacterium]|nr:ABC transporter permease [Armatimonadota bacterium]